MDAGKPSEKIKEPKTAGHGGENGVENHDDGPDEESGCRKGPSDWRR